MPQPPAPPLGPPNDTFLPQQPSPPNIGPPRADFQRERYDELIAQHGVDVLVEKALQCPCKTDKINQLSTCKNCGGTGWIFVNPRTTRLVLQGVGIKTLEDIWTKLANGIVNLSFPPEEDIAYMDRITRLNLESIFSEIIDFDTYLDTTFGFTTYQPNKIDYIGLYQSDDQPLLQLSKSQYSIVNNKLVLNVIGLPVFDKVETPLTATIRYSHAPTFNVIEVAREPIDNYRWTGKGEALQELPGKAIARRTHNVDDLVKLRQGKLLNNNYAEGCV